MATVFLHLGNYISLQYVNDSDVPSISCIFERCITAAGSGAGNYVVVFDPLDGSSNLDAGISTGSIFGIYEPSEECNIGDMDDPEQMMRNCVMNVCQPGNALLAAGYCLYSSSVHFVLTIGKGVWGFTYDSLVGEFVLTHPNMQVQVPPGATHPHMQVQVLSSCHRTPRAGTGPLQLSPDPTCRYKHYPWWDPTLQMASLV